MKQLKILLSRKTIGRRVFSSLLAILLVITTVINPMNMVPVYATSSWIQLSHQDHAKADVEIYTEAESANFIPGEVAAWTLYLENNTEETQTGELTWESDNDVFANAGFVLLNDDGSVIDENGTVTNLSLVPGEFCELRFEGTLSSELNDLEEKTLTFAYNSLNTSETQITGTTEYTFTTGLVNSFTVEPDEESIVPEEVNTMTIRMDLKEIKKAVEAEEDETEIGSHTDSESPSNATIASGSNTDAETPSDADEDETDVEILEATAVKFFMNTYGVTFEDVKVVETAVSDDKTEIVATVQYQAAADTAAGWYFGNVDAEVTIGDGTYEAETGFWVEVAEATVDPVGELFNRLIGCETYEELSDMMDAMTEEEWKLLAQFSDEQNAALTARVEELQMYDMMMLPAQYELNQENYVSSAKVYWDVAVEDDGNWSGYTGTTSERVTSVKLGGTAVTEADSNATSWSNGKALNMYYPNANTSNEETVTLNITPASGYYVTEIVVACCAGGGGGKDKKPGSGQQTGSTPYGCGTWGADVAYNKTFTVEDGTSVSLALPSYAFCHNSKDDNYFILILVAPIPSPLYVEYNYGDIVNLMGENYDSTIFTANADDWTDDSTSNTFVPTNAEAEDLADLQYGVQTNDTQFMYAYPDTTNPDTDDWAHTANTIAKNAKLAAASAGYYFAGWYAEYYETVTDNGENVAGSYNNYNWDFKDLNSTKSYAEGVPVSLITNVKLTAKWEPVELTVTKTVEGLNGEFITNHDYTIQVQKSNGDVWEKYQDVNFTINGNDTDSEIISPITPGTYRVVETVGKDNLTNDTTIMYISVTDGGEYEITSDGIVGGSTRSGELEVINKYSPTPATGNFTITKSVAGIDSSNVPTGSFVFTVTGTDEHTQMVKLPTADNKWSVTLENLKVGNYTVTETATETIGYYTLIKTEADGVDVTTDKTVTASVKSGETSTVNYTNTYKLMGTSITLDKEVIGNLGDRDKEFTFTVTVNGVKLQTDSNKDGEYKLSHSTPEKTIENIPMGAEVVIAETDSDDYTVSATLDGTAKTVSESGALTFTVSNTNGHAVLFTNTKNSTIDTGITMDSIPYILILVAVIGGIAFYVIRKRKYEDLD